MIKRKNENEKVIKYLQILLKLHLNVQLENLYHFLMISSKMLLSNF